MEPGPGGVVVLIETGTGEGGEEGETCVVLPKVLCIRCGIPIPSCPYVTFASDGETDCHSSCYSSEISLLCPSVKSWIIFPKVIIIIWVRITISHPYITLAADGETDGIIPARGPTKISPLCPGVSSWIIFPEVIIIRFC